MLDGVSLDQLRTFVAAAEEGNFSAAGRRLRRAQSVVSQTLANLERQIGVKLFDRSGRVPTLTDKGHALLAGARAVAKEVDLFKARAKGISGELETELSLVVDSMFPVAVLASAVCAFQLQFPSIPLRLHIEMWEGVADPVLDRRCTIGILGSLSPPPPQFSTERLLTVSGINVVSPRHPLATQRAPIPTAALAEHIHLMHVDSSGVWRTARLGLLTQRIWRLCDLAAMHQFLRTGVGFGMMPLHMVQADLTSGALVKIRVEDDPQEGPAITMSAAYLTNKPPGRAGRWFIDRLKEEAAPSVYKAAAVSAGPNQSDYARERQSRAPASNGGVIARSRAGSLPLWARRPRAP